MEARAIKEILIGKGFQKNEGINYTEIFSPFIKLTTIRLVLKIGDAEIYIFSS